MTVLGINEVRLITNSIVDQLDCVKSDFGNGVLYQLPPQNGEGWVLEIHLAPGLCATYAYFTLQKPVVWAYSLAPAGFWLASLERGDLRILKAGKKTEILKAGVHLLPHHAQSGGKMMVGAAEPVRYTSIQMFHDINPHYVKLEALGQDFTVQDAAGWRRQHYDNPEMVMVFEQLKYAIHIAKVPYLYYEGKLIELLALIMRNVENTPLWEKFTEKGRNLRVIYHDRMRIASVKDALDKNLVNPPSIQQLTGIAQMGETKLRRCFKNCYDVSIRDYIYQARMKEAMRLLYNDDMSIYHIAAAVGYESAGKFAAAFKKICGVTPRQFRTSLD